MHGCAVLAEKHDFQIDPGDTRCPGRKEKSGSAMEGEKYRKMQKEEKSPATEERQRKEERGREEWTYVEKRRERER